MDKPDMVLVPVFLLEGLRDTAKTLGSVYALGLLDDAPAQIQAEVKSDLHCLVRCVFDAKQWGIYPK